MLAQVLALSLALQLEPSDERLGWTVEPSPPAKDAELTELDRLSQSSSGNGFFAGLYGGASEDPRVPVAVTLRALNKTTAQFADLDVPIGEAMSFGTLTLLPRTCHTRPPEEFPETTVFLEVYAGEDDIAGQRVRNANLVQQDPELARVSLKDSIDTEMFGQPLFKGWMFASSPSINALEHPTYDVWVINCTMVDPEI
ncbi:MAG: DUF2155 domain-containing protein [Pseudomonadota bacterium]